VAVLLVLLVENKEILAGALVQEVANMFGMNMSMGWLKTYMKQNKDKISKGKTKMLSKKRAMRDIPNHMVRFLVDVKRCDCQFKMMAVMVGNYNKTHVYFGIDGTVSIERQTKKKGMILGQKEESFGTLLAIIGVEGRVWQTVCIFAVAAGK
jgi:hypothetical protein